MGQNLQTAVVIQLEKRDLFSNKDQLLIRVPVGGSVGIPQQTTFSGAVPLWLPFGERFSGGCF